MEYTSNWLCATLTVPATDGIIQPFTIPNDFTPEGYTFTTCVSNERYDKEECKQQVREVGSSQTDIYMTVP